MSDWLTEYEHNPDLPFHMDLRRCGGSYGVRAVTVTTEAFEATLPGVDDIAIGMTLKTDGPGRWDFGDGWSQMYIPRSGAFMYFPAHTEVEWAVYGVSSVDRLNPLAGGDAFTYDPAITQVLRMIAQQETGAFAGAELLFDGLWLMALSRLIHLSDAPPDLPRSALSHSQLRRVTDYVAQHLDRTINMTELAAAVGISSSQFNRAFKTTLGQTPHQYVTQARREQARDMLAKTRLPLPAIAAACGFSSQTHMTDVFRKKLGVTPGQFRHQVLS